MNALDIARIHAAASADPATFVHAFIRATRAGEADLDAESLIAAAIRRDAPAEAAGLLEGLAVLHAAAGMPMHADPIYRRLPAGGTA